MNAWGNLKSYFNRYLAGGLNMFLVKKEFLKENMALRAQFQMLILVCFSQTTN